MKMLSHLASALSRSGVSADTGPGLPSRGEWPARSLRSFLSGVAGDMEDEFYGLTGSSCPPGTHEDHIRTLVTQKTLGEAIEQGCDFLRSRTKGLVFELERSGNIASLAMTMPKYSVSEAEALLAEWHAERWYTLMGWLIGERIPLDRIDFSHPLSFSPHEHSSIFGRQCWFGQKTSRISFASDYLDRRIVHDTRSLRRDWLSRRAGIMPPAPVQRPWSTILREILRSELRYAGALPTMSRLAAELDVDRRTLLRRLIAEGGNFRDLKAEVRLEFVREGVGEGKRSAGELSLMSGFAETTGLARSIKRWTGLTPLQYARIIKMNDPIDDARERHG